MRSQIGPKAPTATIHGLKPHHSMKRIGAAIARMALILNHPQLLQAAARMQDMAGHFGTEQPPTLGTEVKPKLGTEA
ncbi:MAG: hypothetical protein JSS20_15390 [Proteobacteria bacterium]|nr:hypothetical protein [Pseudomonadota bacterium]